CSPYTLHPTPDTLSLELPDPVRRGADLGQCPATMELLQHVAYEYHAMAAFTVPILMLPGNDVHPGSSFVDSVKVERNGVRGVKSVTGHIQVVVWRERVFVFALVEYRDVHLRI